MKFLKCTLLLLMGTLFTATSFAQYTTQKMSLGLTGGLNVTDLRYLLENRISSNNPNTRLLTSFHLGVLADYSASRWVSLQSGALISGKGATLKQSSDEGNFSYRMHPWYFEIPLHLIIRPSAGQSTGFYFGAGPYLAMAIGGKGEYTGPTASSTDYYSDHKLKFGTKSNKDMRGVDFGLDFLAGVAFSKSFMLGVKYGLGITNLSPQKNEDAPGILKNRTFAITLSILFDKSDNYYY